MGAKVSVIVLNHNGGKYLEDCLSSVLAQTYPHLEVLLVDNASTDASSDFVRRTFPGVKLIQTVRNVGFAAGNNLGIALTTGEYVATLNNDAIAHPSWLEELVKAMEGDPRMGMCASKMLLQHHPELVDSAGLAPDLAGMAWNRLCGERNEDMETETMEVFGPCAGAALYRRKMLEAISLDGGEVFDGDFFAYLEDVDLAWRGRLAGWKCLYVPTAEVRHLHSGSCSADPLGKGYLLGRNKLWLIAKDYPSPQVLLFLPLILLYDLGAILYHLLVRRDLGPLRGRWSAFWDLPGMLRKRREIQAKRVTPFSHLAKFMLPLRSPWGMLEGRRRLERLLYQR